MIFDHCIAPDTESGIKGCDNMTLVVVGITHGRTEKAWYKWIKERVKNEYGYETPGTPPPLYADRRLQVFRARQEALAAREKMAKVNNKTLATVPKAEATSRSQLSVAASYFTNLVAVAVAYLTNLTGKLWQSDVKKR